MKGHPLRAGLRKTCQSLAYVFVCSLVSVLSSPYCSQAQTSARNSRLSAQTLFEEAKPLSVGDKAPDIFFHKILNYKSRTARLSDFKSELVILDMWSVYCASCIAAFPKMDALQQKFKGRLQVLLVNPHDPTYDSEDAITSTLEKFKKRSDFYPSLPIPIHDSLLNQYFPHRSVPHTVWLNKERRVIAITGSDAVTEENITRILAGENPGFAVKDDWAFDKEIPFLVNDNGGQSSEFIYRSVFTDYKEGISVISGTRPKDPSVAGVYMINKPLIQYIGQAYRSAFAGLLQNRTVIVSDDPSRFEDKLGPHTSYCYDLSVPMSVFRKRGLNRYLQEDLERTFNITVTRKQQNMRCLVISASKLKPARAGVPERDLDATTKVKFIRRHKVADVLQILDQYDTPLINETGTDVLIDVEFPAGLDLSDKAAVMNTLKGMGFTIREEYRRIEIVEVSDKGSPNSATMKN